MPAWATVVLTLGSSVIVGATALLAAERQNRHASLEREAVARAQRREHAGRVLGRIKVVLLDLEPTRVAVNINNQSVALLPEVNERWNVLRDGLAVFAATDGSPEITEAASALTVEVSNLLNRLGLIIYEQQHPSGLGGKDLYESAKEHYAKARELTDELLALVHSG